MNKQLTPLQADLLLLILAIVWGSGYSVTKVAVEAISPVQFLTYRYVISALLSIIFFRKKIRESNRSDWFAGALAGVFLTAAMLFQTFGLRYTGAGKAVFIASAFVIMVPFFFWLVSKQKPTKKIVCAAFLMMAGLGLMSFSPGGGHTLNIGDVLVLISAVAFAMHTTALGVFAPQKDPYLLCSIQFVVSAMLFLIINVFDSSDQPVTLHIIPFILYSSFVITCLCTLVQVVCQKYTSPSRAAIIINLEAVFGSIMAIMFLGESYTARMVFAFAVVFASVLIAEASIKDLKAFTLFIKTGIMKWKS